MKKVIPFIHGKGKSGQAKTGADRVLIKDTDHYPNAWNHFLEVCNTLNKQAPDATLQEIKKHLLTYLNKITEHVHEAVLHTGEEVIFLNLDSFKGKDFNYLQSFSIDGQRVYLA